MSSRNKKLLEFLNSKKIAYEEEIAIIEELMTRTRTKEDRTIDEHELKIFTEKLDQTKEEIKTLIEAMNK